MKDNYFDLYYNFIRWRWFEWSRNVSIFNLCDLKNIFILRFLRSKNRDVLLLPFLTNIVLFLILKAHIVKLFFLKKLFFKLISVLFDLFQAIRLLYETFFTIMCTLRDNRFYLNLDNATLDQTNSIILCYPRTHKTFFVWTYFWFEYFQR